MSKVYLVVFYTEPPQEENLTAYAVPAKAAIEAMGGKFIARGMPLKTFEVGKAERSVIIEFESAEAAVKAYESERYQEILKRLGVQRDMRVIEGI
jgi:uncharacterized protein (DUF1330 family)